MQVYQFIADSAPAAVEQIRSQLGPDAVVLHVRKPPAQGLARIWQGSRIEVLAGVKPAGESERSQPVETGPAIPSAPSIPVPMSPTCLFLAMIRRPVIRGVRHWRPPVWGLSLARMMSLFV